MGLGSKDKFTRKEFRSVAGKQDWKPTINSKKDAHEFIAAVRVNMAKDPNGVYLKSAYVDNKIKQLEDYILEAPSATMTLKEFQNGYKT